jgi:hypothetical protein
VFASGLLPAQTASRLFKGAWERDYLINGEIKYIFQGTSGIEAGINFSKYTTFLLQLNGLSDNCIFLSSEIKFLKEKTVLGPKAGFGTYFIHEKLKGTGIHLRCSSVLYEPGETNDLRILPEASLTFLGILNLGYAYSIPVLKNEIKEIPRHSFIVGFHFGYWRSMMNVLDMSGGM